MLIPVGIVLIVARYPRPILYRPLGVRRTISSLVVIEFVIINHAVGLIVVTEIVDVRVPRHEIETIDRIGIRTRAGSVIDLLMDVASAG